MLILASKSPRRIELLSEIGIEFSCCPAENDEIVEKNLSPEEAIKKIAEAKALEVYGKFPRDVILSADTAVVLKNKILGKPSNKNDAISMLKLLSGKEHCVYTAVCIISNGVIDSFCEKSIVEFYKLSEDEIIEYVNTNEPMDKAGAYGIQGKGAIFVKRIDGDYFNIVGLPIAKIWRKLKAL